MKNILSIEMELAKEKGALSLDFEVNLIEQLEDVLDEKDVEKLEGLLDEVCEVISNALVKDARREVMENLKRECEKVGAIQEELKKVDAIQEELKASMTEEDKKEVERVEKRLEGKSPMEQIMVLFEEISKLGKIK